MSEKSIVITEQDGNYQIHNSVLNEFELLGLLEQIIFDLKYSRKEKTTTPEVSTPPEESRQTEKSAPVETANKTADAAPKAENVQESAPESAPKSIPKNSASPELKTRIGNAIKAIRDLGGKVENNDLSQMSEDELQTELEELTAQYKRLKSAKS